MVDRDIFTKWLPTQYRDKYIQFHFYKIEENPNLERRREREDLDSAASGYRWWSTSGTTEDKIMPANKIWFGWEVGGHCKAL